MAASKFKPKVSSNIIEGATPATVEEADTEVTMTPESNEGAVEDMTPETTTPDESTVPETEGEADAEVSTGEETVVEEETPATVEEAPVGDTEDLSDEDKGENSETAPPTPTVMFEDKDSEKKIAERNVKVCVKVNHSCVIGGETYHFEKGKQVNVPQSVKSILMQADLLMPL